MVTPVYLSTLVCPTSIWILGLWLYFIVFCSSGWCHLIEWLMCDYCDKRRWLCCRYGAVLLWYVDDAGLQAVSVVGNLLEIHYSASHCGNSSLWWLDRHSVHLDNTLASVALIININLSICHRCFMNASTIALFLILSSKCDFFCSLV